MHWLRHRSATCSMGQLGYFRIARLIGMFAFAIYDRENNSVTLVRDAFGIKPVFYTSMNLLLLLHQSCGFGDFNGANT